MCVCVCVRARVCVCTRTHTCIPRADIAPLVPGGTERQGCVISLQSSACVRACVRACLHLCQCVRACLHLCQCVRACVRACICVTVCVYVHVCVRVRLSLSLSLFVCARVLTRVFLLTCASWCVVVLAGGRAGGRAGGEWRVSSNKRNNRGGPKGSRMPTSLAHVSPAQHA